MINIYSLRKSHMLIFFSAFLAVTFASSSVAQPSPYISVLNLSQGELPNDTAMENATQLSIVDFPPLGEATLRVDYAATDSFGLRNAGPNNWSLYSHFEFTVYNPSADEIDLSFVLRHGQSTDAQSRVQRRLALSSGENKISLTLSELLDRDGGKPALDQVRHWYLAVGRISPTLYFKDFRLIPSDIPAIDNSQLLVDLVNSEIGDLKNYRITGLYNELAIDVTVAAGVAAENPGAAVQIDPFRLARIKSTLPVDFDSPIMFDTEAADSVVAALEIFPPDNPFNQLVSAWPVHPNSENIVDAIGRDAPMRYNQDMAYVLVPPGQAQIEVDITQYAHASDNGPFPIPDNLPIEGWPAKFKTGVARFTGPTLREVQETGTGDRHAIVVDPVNRMLYEFANMYRLGDGWTATQASIFDLSSNDLRPDGWTSADAAGLPIFPATVRFDELARGEIEHALRVTVPKTTRQYVAPATHFASQLTDPNLPRMGERIRLRANFDMTGFSEQARTILRALQRYGMFVADNGNPWAISVAPDMRISDMHSEFRRLKGADFEIVLAP